MFLRIKMCFFNVFMLGGELQCNLWHRRNVASLCMLYKIVKRSEHPVHFLLPSSFDPRRNTCCADAMHSRAFENVRWFTRQFSCSFVPACVKLWNALSEDVFAFSASWCTLKVSVRYMELGSFYFTFPLSFFLI